MNKYQILPLDYRSLDNANFAQLLASTIETVTAFNQKQKKEAFYSETLPVLVDKLEQFEASLHKIRASQVAKSLEAADRERDRALTTVTKLVRAYSSVPSEPIATSYKLLSGLLKNYTINSKSSYEEESQLLRHLLKELVKDKYTTAIATLHLNQPIISLLTAQEQFEERYKERLAEQSSHTPSQAKALRKELLDCYQLLIDYTAINVAAHPEKTDLATLRDDLNSIRKRYKNTNSKRKEEN